MPRGGARPGAGAKPAELKVVQVTKRAQLIQYVTDSDWQVIVEKAVEQARNGDYSARMWLTPWLLGAPPKDQEDVTRIKLVE